MERNHFVLQWIRNNIDKKTTQLLEDLFAGIKVTKEDMASVLKEVLSESVQLALESSYKTHHSAKMNVTVSNKYIIKSINQINAWNA